MGTWNSYPWQYIKVSGMPAKSLKLMGKPELVTAAKPQLIDHTFLHQLQWQCKISFQPMVTQLIVKKIIFLQTVNTCRGSQYKYTFKNSCNTKDNLFPPFSTPSQSHFTACTHGHSDPYSKDAEQAGWRKASVPVWDLLCTCYRPYCGRGLCQAQGL